MRKSRFSRLFIGIILFILVINLPLSLALSGVKVNQTNAADTGPAGPTGPQGSVNGVWKDARTITVDVSPNADLNGDYIDSDGSANRYDLKVGGGYCKDEIRDINGGKSLAKIYPQHLAPSGHGGGCIDDNSIPITLSGADKVPLSTAFRWVDKTQIDSKSDRHYKAAGEQFGTTLRFYQNNQNESSTCPDYVEINSGDTSHQKAKLHISIEVALDVQNETDAVSKAKTLYANEKDVAFFLRTSAQNGNCFDINPIDLTLQDPQNATKDPKLSEGSTTCDIGALSWMICPIINDILVPLIKSAEAEILSLLQTEPLASGGSIYNVWSEFRNLTDALFVILFLLIIFGTTVGVEAYTVKKALPRLVAAVIFVQFSFLLSSLAIDITNIIGVNIHSLVPGLGDVHFGIPASVSLTIIGFAVAAITATTLATLLTGLLLAAIAVMAVFVTIAARKLLIILLVVLSPLAFAAWVLPNTENLFKVWLKNFTKVLLMFPMIAILFSLSGLAAQINASTNTGGFGSIFVQLLLVVVPLFAIPFTFKWAGGAMSATAGVISNISGRAQKTVKEPTEAAIKRGQERMAQTAQYGKTRAGRLFGRVLSRPTLGGAAVATGRDTRGAKIARFRTLAAAKGEAEKLAASATTTEDLVEGATRGPMEDRIAFMGEAAKRSDRKALEQLLIRTDQPTMTAYEQASGRNADAFAKNPDLRRFPGQTREQARKSLSELSIEDLLGSRPDSLDRMARSGRISQQISDFRASQPEVQQRLLARASDRQRFVFSGGVPPITDDDPDPAQNAKNVAEKTAVEKQILTQMP